MPFQRLNHLKYKHENCFVSVVNKVLEQIKDFADKAHGDQLRKYSPERYIAHPVRVMETCQKYSASTPVLAAALLHDVLEDTEVSSEELKDYLLSVMSEVDVGPTLKLVTELTDVYTKKNYPRLNRKRRRVKEAERLANSSADAQTIKYADIMDNCKAIAGQDSDFAPVFLEECKLLLDQMTKGNSELRQQALRVVNEEMQQLQQ